MHKTMALVSDLLEYFSPQLTHWISVGVARRTSGHIEFKFQQIKSELISICLIYFVIYLNLVIEIGNKAEISKTMH